eukprot:3771616-Rhodomonas_salina.3
MSGIDKSNVHDMRCAALRSAVRVTTCVSHRTLTLKCDITIHGGSSATSPLSSRHRIATSQHRFSQYPTSHSSTGMACASSFSFDMLSRHAAAVQPYSKVLAAYDDDPVRSSFAPPRALTICCSVVLRKKPTQERVCRQRVSMSPFAMLNYHAPGAPTCVVAPLTSTLMLCKTALLYGIDVP